MNHFVQGHNIKTIEKDGGQSAGKVSCGVVSCGRWCRSRSERNSAEAKVS